VARSQIQTRFKFWQAPIPPSMTIDERLGPTTADRANAILLWVFLYGLADNDKKLFWKQSRLAAGIGWSRRTLQRVLATLVTVHLVSVEDHKAEGKASVIYLEDPMTVYESNDLRQFPTTVSARSKASENPQGVVDDTDDEDDDTSPASNMCQMGNPASPMTHPCVTHDASLAPPVAGGCVTHGASKGSLTNVNEEEELKDLKDELAHTASGGDAHLSQTQTTEEGDVSSKEVGVGPAPIRPRSNDTSDLTPDPHAGKGSGWSTQDGKRKSKAISMKPFQGKPSMELLRHFGKVLASCPDFRGVEQISVGPRELKLLGAMLEGSTKEQIEQMIECMVFDWNAFSEMYRWAGPPSIMALYTKKDVLSVAVQTGKGLFTRAHRVSAWSQKQKVGAGKSAALDWRD